MGRKKKYHLEIDKSTLADLYWKQGLSYQKIGQLYGVPGDIVRLEAQNLGIPPRTLKAIYAARKEKYRIEKDVLHRLYIEEKLTLQEVADQLSVSTATVLKWAKIHGIPTRKRGYKSSGKKRVYIPKKQLYQMYVVEELSTEAIGKKLGVSRKTIQRRLDAHGIPIRKRGPHTREHQRKGVPFRPTSWKYDVHLVSRVVYCHVLGGTIEGIARWLNVPTPVVCDVIITDKSKKEAKSE